MYFWPSFQLLSVYIPPPGSVCTHAHVVVRVGTPSVDVLHHQCFVYHPFQALNFRASSPVVSSQPSMCHVHLHPRPRLLCDMVLPLVRNPAVGDNVVRLTSILRARIQRNVGADVDITRLVRIGDVLPAIRRFRNFLDCVEYVALWPTVRHVVIPQTQ